MVLEVSHTVPILVRVFEDWETEWVEVRGGTPVQFAHAAGDAFLDWFADPQPFPVRNDRDLKRNREDKPD